MRPRFVGQCLQVGGLAGKCGHIGGIGFEQSADGFVGAAEIFHIAFTRSHIGIISIGVAEKGQQAKAEAIFQGGTLFGVAALCIRPCWIS